MNLKYFFTGVIFLLFSIFSIWFHRRKKIDDDVDEIPSLLSIRYVVAVVSAGIGGIILIIKFFPF
jgi:predicted permease